MRRISIADPLWMETSTRHLSSGMVLAVPTETVYGLAGALLSPSAVNRIIALKGRPEDKALPLQMASTEAALGFGFEFSPQARRLAARFWPGPLTLVLPRPAALPDWYAPGASTTALRVPSHGATRTLLERWGSPLAITSANRSGGREAVSAREVEEIFAGAADLLVVDGGSAAGGSASTIVDATGPAPVILRAGPVSQASVEEVWHGRE
ncbi:MAG: L-threonylcarbamoyladenylate synthase [Acidobacteriota bacterium]